MWTQRSAPVVKGAAEDTIRASQIVGSARILDIYRTADKDRVIEEAAQTDPKL